MSTLTESGRRQIRDYQRNWIIRKLGQDAALAHLPRHQRDTLAELKLVGRSLYADIKRRGVMLPDGTVNPAVEIANPSPLGHPSTLAVMKSDLLFSLGWRELLRDHGQR